MAPVSKATAEGFSVAFIRTGTTDHGIEWAIAFATNLRKMSSSSWKPSNGALQVAERYPLGSLTGGEVWPR